MMITFSKHGADRAQQRGIPPVILDWLLKYGHVTRRYGADMYYFDKLSRKELRSELGILYKRVEPMLNVYAVISDDDVVITTAKQTKKFLT